MCNTKKLPMLTLYKKPPVGVAPSSLKFPTFTHYKNRRMSQKAPRRPDLIASTRTILSL